jgi:hypothetical protein
MTRLEVVVNEFRYAALKLIAEDRALEQEGDTDKGVALLRQVRYSLYLADWERLVQIVNAANDPDAISPK